MYCLLFKLLSLQVALGMLGSVIANPTPNANPSLEDSFWHKSGGYVKFSVLHATFDRPVEDAETPAELEVVDTLAGERIGAANGQLQPCYNVRYLDSYHFLSRFSIPLETFRSSFSISMFVITRSLILVTAVLTAGFKHKLCQIFYSLLFVFD